MEQRLSSARFPRASRYPADWVAAGASGGANVLWLAEWLSEALELAPGMRVLDLACGRAMSSIFLQREFGVEVWAADLWFDPSENLQRIRDAGAGHAVFPLRVDARALPFGAGFFDAIVCLDAYMYFGTDDHYLANLLRFLKPGGRLGIAMSGLVEELPDEVPEHLRGWWTHDMRCLHSATWWRRLWARTGLVEVELADTLDEGWRRWLEWQRFLCPDNVAEIDAIEADRGRWLGYVRAVARRLDRPIADPIVSIPAQYERRELPR
jgi:cyclopropane fatty-acyl-phospholipid synthase-like methyltransferase